MLGFVYRWHFFVPLSGLPLTTYFCLVQQAFWFTFLFTSPTLHVDSISFALHFDNETKHSRRYIRIYIFISIYRALLQSIPHNLGHTSKPTLSLFLPIA